MSTHCTLCIVCHQAVYCSNDAHALGCGGKKGEGGCNNPPYIEFCSIHCFEELERRMVRSKKNWQDVMKEEYGQG